MKKLTSILAVVFAVLFILPTPIEASKPYQTYTYSIDGSPRNSPDAYVPTMTVDSKYIGLTKAFDEPRDLFVDVDHNVYIADSKGNRIIVTDKYYKLKFTIEKFTNDQGVPDELSAPNGVYANEKNIYVADTDANRIVIFDREGNFERIIEQPKSSLFAQNAVYKPVAIAVDLYERIYVVSSTTYEGVVVLTSEGEFSGFIGAQKVTYNALDILWRNFQSKEARELTVENISSEFNNITVNKDGFVYVTTDSIPENDVRKAITGKSKSGDYAPVKMLNASGEEIMSRNGFYPPSGEIRVSSSSLNAVSGTSKVVDVAIGPAETWSIIDEKRSRIYTYDFNGNLLFAFGDKGEQLGNLSSIEGIAYQGDTMLVLDKTADNITVYRRTEYGDLLIQALTHQNARQYDLAINDWTEILKRNSNFDTAYIGIGQSLFRSGKFAESLEYYEFAYDVDNYSDSYKELRKNWMSKYIILIPILAVALLIGLSQFFKYAGKVNKATAVKLGKRTLKEEILFGFHLIFHPFDGFWDLKHEKRGSFRGAMVWLLIAIVSFFYQAIGQGYIMNPRGSYVTIVDTALSILVPLALLVVANWCLTTLFDGEGSMKDLFIATSYSLVPVPLLIIPATIASNFVSLDEVTIVNLLVTVTFLWVGMLIFLGMMVTHDYSMGKNIVITICTIFGACILVGIALLFTSLLAKMVGFVSNLIIEINYRL